MRTSIFVVLFGAVLLGAALLGAACSDDDDGQPTATVEPSPSLTATTTAAPPTTATATSTPDETPPATPPTRPPTATPSAVPPAGPAAAADGARDALARWLGPVGDPSAITVSSVEAVTWPNGCLGLGGSEEACTEAEVPGYRVMLDLANATYEVRIDEGGELARWAPSIQLLAQFADAGPNVFEFTSDDGGPIVAQAVPGTVFRVDVAALEAGDAVGLGLVDAPQSGGWLLVSLDPVVE